MLPDDRLIAIINGQRPQIIRDYVAFNQQFAGSKFSKDDVEIISARINILLDNFIATVAEDDGSIFLRYAEDVTKTRLADGYNPDAIIRLWDWGINYFTNLIELDEPDAELRTSYIRQIRSILNTAKLVVAKANLERLSG